MRLRRRGGSRAEDLIIALEIESPGGTGVVASGKAVGGLPQSRRAPGYGLALVAMLLVQLAAIVVAGIVVPGIDPTPLFPIALVLDPRRRHSPGGAWLVTAAVLAAVSLAGQATMLYALFRWSSTEGLWALGMVLWLGASFGMWIAMLAASGVALISRRRAAQPAG